MTRTAQIRLACVLQTAIADNPTRSERSTLGMRDVSLHGPACIRDMYSASLSNILCRDRGRAMCARAAKRHAATMSQITMHIICSCPGHTICPSCMVLNIHIRTLHPFAHVVQQCARVHCPADMRRSCLDISAAQQLAQPAEGAFATGISAFIACATSARTSCRALHGTKPNYGAADVHIG